MKPVIIAEKPDQAREYANALGNFKRKQGFIEIEPNNHFTKGAVITWAIGHLVELSNPKEYRDDWGIWNYEQLPMIPDAFKYVLVDSKKDHFKTVSALLKKASEIIIATDAGREGENIARLIIKQSNCENKPIKRLWVSSLSESSVLKGFASLKDGRDYETLFQEAQARQVSDWIVGLNATRLYTILLQKQGIKDNFTVGRVQTPTLYMIYEREEAIKNFEPKPFYELELKATHYNGVFIGKSTIKEENKQDIIEIAQRHNMEIDDEFEWRITDVQQTLEKQPSPKLHSLSSIQTKANKRWQYSPKSVLKFVQSLYEKKLVTYPRTDTQFITNDEFDYLLNHVEEYQELVNVTFPVRTRVAEKRYVNSSKVKEHHAIIPTDRIPSKESIDSLEEEEKNIYFEIIRNTIAMFHNQYEFKKTVINVDINSMVFTTTGREEIDKGWKSLYSSSEVEEDVESPVSLPKVSIGDNINTVVSIKEGKTTKPKRLTEGDLVSLMIHSGKELVEEDKETLNEVQGIGTEATRADIIETLKDRNYIKIQKNKVHVTSKGVILCEAVKGSLLSSPSMTAKWEQFLKLIGTGERSKETFVEGIKKFINKLVVEAPEQMKNLNITNSIENFKKENILGECPLCKKGDIENKKAIYGCTNFKNGCKQTFSQKLLDKVITETQIKKLLSKGKTDVIKGFKSKKNPFNAYLTLELDETLNVYKYKFNFQNTKK
ncbi:type IA DNA topoisomerase [Bacillus safensis]|uniref:type IA DNA topoisomerase n=1 Tax=Bacillus safensis TaxID=561879 RepID=UPI003670710D